MGIFPYQTPEEHKRADKRIKHYDEFLELKGYKKFLVHPYVPPIKGPFLAKDGNVYEDSDLFHKATGWFPYLVKNGVYYGLYEPHRNDGYVYPYYDECDFLRDKGYSYAPVLSEDYLENNNLEEKHYEEHGYVPRWEKDGKTFGHEQLLKLEGYVYSGEPPLPL